MSGVMNEAELARVFKAKFRDQLWRLNNLYWIKNKQGKRVKFKLNWMQRTLLSKIWYFNVILKARQLGTTTFTMLYFLDCCLFNNNHAAGVVAHTKEDAQDLFDNKVKFAYDNLPDWLKEQRVATTDTARKMMFNNGSSFNVGTSLRSGTYQKLLISEYGKLSAKYPEKAREIKTGALNTIEAGQQIFIESTAEGKSGEFFDICEQARNLEKQKKQLTRLEPKFHFFAWFDNPEYRLTDEETANTVVPKELAKYLDGFPRLDANQRAWYAAKSAVMGEDMHREFPATPEESFEGSLEGAFYTQEMQSVRKSCGICRLPYDPAYPVSTYWDLGGARDQFSIWFYQYIKRQHRFINYHESNGNGWNFYAKLLNDLGYVYDKHYMPHDANTRRVGREVYTSAELAEQVGIRPIEVIPVTKSVYDDIRNFCKPFLPQCLFDEVNCALGIQRLDNYRKRWDDINGMWMNEAVHDSNSHGSDAMRTAAVALKDGNQSDIKPSQYSILGNGNMGVQPFISNSPNAWMGR
jgi:hypothetical protein